MKWDDKQPQFDYPPTLVPGKRGHCYSHLKRRDKKRWQRGEKMDTFTDKAWHAHARIGKAGHIPSTWCRKRTIDLLGRLQ